MLHCWRLGRTRLERLKRSRELRRRFVQSLWHSKHQKIRASDDRQKALNNSQITAEVSRNRQSARRTVSDRLAELEEEKV